MNYSESQENNERVRNKSFGQGHTLTFIDKLGINLSNGRIVNLVRKKRPKRIVDLGCGYNAYLLNSLKKYSNNLVGVDVSVNKKIGGIKFHERAIKDNLNFLEDSSADLVIMNSVLEHLENPLEILKEVYRILDKNGVAVINVPNWLGKYALEYSAFKLKLSPADEMNDHKMYYGKRDLWPLIVKSGFKPDHIKIQYYKLFLNTICYARR